MNLIGKRFKHKMFGIGAVSAQTENELIVDFPSRTSKFVFNEQTFTKFITAEDPDVHAAILKELEDLKEAKKQEALEIALAKQREEEAKLAALAAKQPASERKPARKKPTARQERIPGKRMTYYVFQGGTFAIESRGGFIWAPLYAQDGGNCFNWDNLAYVKEGDIILHGCNAHVVAVSVAVSDGYDSKRPQEQEFEDTWDIEGRRVDLKYTIFQNPIKTADFRQEILKYCAVKYSPFNKNGKGNLGYLYELNRDLARIFLTAAVRSNPYLADIEYVAELLEEKTDNA